MQAFHLQNKIRQNASARFDYLNDLRSWQDSAERLDKSRSKRRKKITQKKTLPPVRGGAVSTQSEEEKSPPIVSQTQVVPRPAPTPPVTSAAAHTYDNYSKWNKICDDEDELDSTSRTKTNRTVINSDTNQPARDASTDGDCQTTNQLREEGNRFFRLKKFSIAIEHYNKALKLSPDDLPTLCNRAFAHLKCSNYEAAEQDCTKCIELDDTYVKAWFRRALARKHLKKRRQAKQDLDRVLELDAANVDARREKQEISKQIKMLKEKKRAQKAADPNQFRRIPVETFWEEDEPVSEKPVMSKFKDDDAIPCDFEEFEVAWRLGCSVSRRCSLLGNMCKNGRSLLDIVGKMLDDALLGDMLEVIDALCEDESPFASELFSQLSQIDRFSMLTMFLDGSHRALLERVTSRVGCAG